MKMNAHERKITTELAAMEQRLQEQVINNEKRIAQAFLDAQKMHEESYRLDSNLSNGGYTKDIEECFIATCKEQGLSSNLWRLFSIANCNAFKHWAENILDEIWD